MVLIAIISMVTFCYPTIDFNEAEKYFKRAIAIPARTEQFYADNQLKEEAKLALKNTKERKISSSKGLFASLFNSESVK